MAYYSQRIILIALVFAIAVPSSLGDCGDNPPPVQPGEFDSFNYLRELCSQTNHTKECWYFVKPQFNRFNETKKWGIIGVAPMVLSLVMEKAYQIQDILDKLYNGSKDQNLKFKYISCSNNYKDAIINLELMKRSFHMHDYDNILVQIDGVGEELKRCVSNFTENSLDPALIRNRNNVFGIYVEFLKVATVTWVDMSRRD